MFSECLFSSFCFLRRNAITILSILSPVIAIQIIFTIFVFPLDVLTLEPSADKKDAVSSGYILYHAFISLIQYISMALLFSCFKLINSGKQFSLSHVARKTLSILPNFFLLFYLIGIISFCLFLFSFTLIDFIFKLMGVDISFIYSNALIFIPSFFNCLLLPIMFYVILQKITFTDAYSKVLHLLKQHAVSCVALATFIASCFTLAFNGLAYCKENMEVTNYALCNIAVTEFVNMLRLLLIYRMYLLLQEKEDNKARLD